MLEISCIHGELRGANQQHLSKLQATRASSECGLACVMCESLIRELSHVASLMSLFPVAACS